MKIFDILCIGDPHIEEEAVDELEDIFTEIISYKAKKLIILGDYYTKNRPTAKELEFGTKWIKGFLEYYGEVILLKGNHGKVANNISCVDYLQYLSTSYENDDHELIENRVKIVEDYEIETPKTYFGHFMINESALAFGSGEKSLEDLKAYDYVVLGHQHKFQQITPKICHLGSIRRVDYGEASYDTPQLLAFDRSKPIYLPLVSYTTMKTAYGIGQMRDIFEETKGLCKIYIIFKTFNQFLNEIEEVNKLKEKFIDMKIKLDFEKEKQVIVGNKQSFKELFYEFISKLDKPLQDELKKEIENVI